MEIYHFSPDSVISRSQSELLSAARQSQVSTLGWPTAVVLDREEFRPKPTNEGILAIVSAEGRDRFDYWTLTKSGNFYSLMSLSEDRRRVKGSREIVWFNILIAVTRGGGAAPLRQTL